MTCTLVSLRTKRWSCSASSSIHTKLAMTKKWRRPAMTVQANCGETQPHGHLSGHLSHPESRPHLIFEVFLVPEQQQVRHGEVEAQVKTGCVVDLRIPATQEEGEDGQAEEE